LAQRQTVDLAEGGLLLTLAGFGGPGAAPARAVVCVITGSGTNAYAGNEGQARRRPEGRKPPPSGRFRVR